MNRQLIQLTLISLLAGLVLLSLSIFVARKSSYVDQDCGLHGVQRGFPLPYLKLMPSPSICNSVESISILHEGNAGHEQLWGNAAIDWLVWSGLTAVVVTGLRKLKR